MILLDRPGHLPTGVDLFAFLGNEGSIHVRGVGASGRVLADYVASFSAELVAKPGTEIIVLGERRFVQPITFGTDPIQLHCESGFSAQRPDIAAFCCERAASCGGGHTTVCDGVQLWRHLHPAIRRRFESNRVTSTLRVPIDVLQGMSLDSAFGDPGRANARISGFRAEQVVKVAGREVTLRFTCSAVVRTRAGLPSFSNNILSYLDAARGWRRDDLGHDVRFEDGAPIPEDVELELRRATEATTQLVKWCGGDVLILDNIRCMHGRTAFRDDGRRMFAVFSNLGSTRDPPCPSRSEPWVEG